MSGRASRRGYTVTNVVAAGKYSRTRRLRLPSSHVDRLGVLLGASSRCGAKLPCARQTEEPFPARKRYRMAYASNATLVSAGMKSAFSAFHVSLAGPAPPSQSERGDCGAR